MFHGVKIVLSYSEKNQEMRSIRDFRMKIIQLIS